MSARAPRRSADDLMARVGAALAPVLIALVRDPVREEVRVGGEAAAWVPHPRWPCASRWTACALARAGALEDVRRLGQGRGARCLVRRAVLDAWIEAHSIDAASEQQEPQDDDYEREIARRGLVPGTSQAQRGRR
jgi:hypothetical protein